MSEMSNAALDHDHLFQRHGEQGLVWRLSVHRAPGVAVHASNFLGLRSFCDQTALMDTICQYLLNSPTIDLYLRGREVDIAMQDICHCLQEDMRNPPLRSWYPRHPDRAIIKPGEYLLLENRPPIDDRSKLSFVNVSRALQRACSDLEQYEFTDPACCNRLRSRIDSIISDDAPWKSMSLHLALRPFTSAGVRSISCDRLRHRWSC